MSGALDFSSYPRRVFGRGHKPRPRPSPRTAVAVPNLPEAGGPVDFARGLAVGALNPVMPYMPRGITNWYWSQVLDPMQPRSFQGGTELGRHVTPIHAIQMYDLHKNFKEYAKLMEKLNVGAANRVLEPRPFSPMGVLLMDPMMAHYFVQTQIPRPPRFE